jgi:hypothetical protein
VAKDRNKGNKVRNNQDTSRGLKTTMTMLEDNEVEEDA